MSILLRICATCKSEMGQRLIEDGKDEVQKTHGYCRPCFLRTCVEAGLASAEETREFEEMLDRAVAEVVR